MPQKSSRACNHHSTTSFPNDERMHVCTCQPQSALQEERTTPLFPTRNIKRLPSLHPSHSSSLRNNEHRVDMRLGPYISLPRPPPSNTLLPTHVPPHLTSNTTSQRPFPRKSESMSAIFCTHCASTMARFYFLTFKTLLSNLTPTGLHICGKKLVRLYCILQILQCLTRTIYRS